MDDQNPPVAADGGPLLETIGATDAPKHHVNILRQLYWRQKCADCGAVYVPRAALAGPRTCVYHPQPSDGYTHPCCGAPSEARGCCLGHHRWDAGLTADGTLVMLPLDAAERAGLTAHVGRLAAYDERDVTVDCENFTTTTVADVGACMRERGMAPPAPHRRVPAFVVPAAPAEFALIIPRSLGPPPP